MPRRIGFSLICARTCSGLFLGLRRVLHQGLHADAPTLLGKDVVDLARREHVVDDHAFHVIERFGDVVRALEDRRCEHRVLVHDARRREVVQVERLLDLVRGSREPARPPAACSPDRCRSGSSASAAPATTVTISDREHHQLRVLDGRCEQERLHRFHSLRVRRRGVRRTRAWDRPDAASSQADRSR